MMFFIVVLTTINDNKVKKNPQKAKKFDLGIVKKKNFMYKVIFGTTHSWMILSNW